MEVKDSLSLIWILILTILTLYIIGISFLRYKKKTNSVRKFVNQKDKNNKYFDENMLKNERLDMDIDKESKSTLQYLFDVNVIINNIEIGLAFVNEYGIIFTTNRYFEQIFYPDEVLGENIDNLLRRKSFNLKNGLNSRYNSDKLYLNINNELKCFTIKKIPIVNNKVIMIVLYDKTDLMNLEKEIEEYKKLRILKVIAGSLAHDLNNQLGVILTYTERILYQPNLKLAKDIVRMIEIIKRTCLRAKTLTQELLIFGKKLCPVKEPIPIKDFLTELAEFTFSGTGISLYYSYDPRIQIIYADRNLLEIAIHNIFLNAKQAMGDRGKIFISTDYKAQFAEIAIRDTGPGIPPEVKEKLFTPFVTTKPTGTGLGLFSIKKILEAHGGKVAIESELGMGTTVKLHLPVERGMEEVVKPSQPGQPLFQVTRKLKILYMDDDMDIREAMVELLGSFDHEVVGCESGEEAIKIYEEKGPFDLFIFDLTVPGKFDGFQTLKEIRKMDPNIKAVLTTGHSDLEVHQELHELKIHGVLLKPFTIEALLGILSKVS